MSARSEMNLHDIPGHALNFSNEGPSPQTHGTEDDMNFNSIMDNQTGESHAHWQLSDFDNEGWAPQEEPWLLTADFTPYDGQYQNQNKSEFPLDDVDEAQNGSLGQLPPAPQEIVRTTDGPQQIDGYDPWNDAEPKLADDQDHWNLPESQPANDQYQWKVEEPEAVDQKETDRGEEEADDTTVQKLTPHRSPRSREGWKMSDVHETVSASFSAGPAIWETRNGTKAGRNWFVKFGDDKTPRLRCNLRIRRSKDEKNNEAARAWPDPNEVHIPARTSLEEICQNYPRHVWGTGLRLFGSEGWDAKQIYDKLPDSFKHKGAKTRQWNYLQAALGRELDKMVEEEGRPRSVTKRGGKRKAIDDEDESEEDLPRHVAKRRHGVNNDVSERPAFTQQRPLAPAMTQRPQAAQPAPMTRNELMYQLALQRNLGQPQTMQQQPTANEYVVNSQRQAGRSSFPDQAQQQSWTSPYNVQPNSQVRQFGEQPSLVTSGPAVRQTPQERQHQPGVGRYGSSVQASAPRMSSLAEDMRRRHFRILNARLSNEAISFTSQPTRARHDQIESIWMRRLYEFIGSLRVRWPGAESSEVALNMAVRILHQVLILNPYLSATITSRETSRIDRHDLEGRAWGWMYDEMQKWSSEWANVGEGSYAHQ